MRHRQLRFLLAAIVLGIGAFTAAAFGQLPSSIVTSPDLSPDQRDQVQKMVDQQVQKMTNAADPTQWGSGRAILINEVGKQGATPGFFDAYAEILNKNLLPLAADKDRRVRLNAAIVAARVAAKADNGRLEQVTEKFLKDPSDAVVLWGLQSAKYVIPALLKVADTNHANTLGKEAVEAAENHMTPAIIEEAYRTLLLDPTLPEANLHVIDNLNGQALSSFLPNPMALFEYRIKLYDEVEPPKQPEADTWVALFLVSEKVWGVETPIQQSQSLSLMLGLLEGAAKQNAAVASPEMLDVIKRTGQSFQVISRLLKKPKLTEAANKIAGITTNTSPDEISTAVDNLDAAVKDLGLPTPPAATARNP